MASCVSSARLPCTTWPLYHDRTTWELMSRLARTRCEYHFNLDVSGWIRCNIKCNVCLMYTCIWIILIEKWSLLCSFPLFRMFTEPASTKKFDSSPVRNKANPYIHSIDEFNSLVQFSQHNGFLLDELRLIPSCPISDTLCRPTATSSTQTRSRSAWTNGTRRSHVSTTITHSIYGTYRMFTELARANPCWLIVPVYGG